MCLRDVKTDAIAPGPEAVTGKISVSEFREAVDYRVAMKLNERDFIRSQYQRGFSDALYIIAMLASIAYVVYMIYWAGDE